VTLIFHDIFFAQTGIPSTMRCTRGYRNSFTKCKSWALKNCHTLTMDERMWLKGKTSRTRRSSWFCTAGVFGIFKAIYEGTGHSCENNHVTKKSITAVMITSRHLIRIVNGKFVHLFKMTDNINTKLNKLIHSVRGMDKTFKNWKVELERIANKVECNDYLNVAFLSKFATESNRAFSVIMRFLRYQKFVDIL